jgi:nucleoside diphosphate kinase
MPSPELAYVIVTPYSLHKSRTGGILARLISRTGLNLVGARMFGPSSSLIQDYSEAVVSAADPQERWIQELIRDYVVENLGPDPKSGRRRRVMMLLFQGEEAARKIRAVVGHITVDRRTGETIRDTFGDLVVDEAGTVRYFEPAVLASPTAEEADRKLRIWARYSDEDGGVLDNTIAYEPSENPQRTLVLIKPDNFRFPTGRPGNVIDFFSRTGLYIIGIKVHRMSVDQAVLFYEPVKEILKTRFDALLAEQAGTVLEKELGFRVPALQLQQIGHILGPVFGENQFANIVKFMSGQTPAECEPALRDQPGTEKCIALIYEGIDAVRKIREVLGPTDPSKALPGSIRREFGQTVMINAAHASDSEGNARREIEIINAAENNFKEIIRAYCGL